MRENDMTPASTAPIGEKISAATLTSGGITFPLWIDYFDHWLKLFITVIYLIVAVYTLQKQVIRPILAERRRKRRTKHS